jgi:hypothetical protein
MKKSIQDWTRQRNTRNSEREILGKKRSLRNKNLNKSNKKLNGKHH